MGTSADGVNEAIEARMKAAEEAAAAKRRWREEMAGKFQPTGRTTRDVEGARMVVRLAKKDEKKGSIVLPDDQRLIATQGVVLTVGPGCQFKAGDQVMFSQHVGTAIAFSNGDVDPEYRVINEFEVYGCWPTEVKGDREPQDDVQHAAD